MKQYRISLVLLILPYLVFAAEEGKFEELPKPPPLPTAVESGEPIEPEVTIIRKEEAVIEEYRVNGNLYMVKITPSVGKPYYLVDHDGDGQLSRTNTPYEDIRVPQWVLFSW